ncbi:MAG: glutaminyl-peptide cyclotransferase, partial [Gammaproteobacteria bacterium]
MSRNIHSALLSGLCLSLLGACEPGDAVASGGTWVPEVVARYPHDTNAFTQGLIFYDGYLYESTGRRGQSSLRKVNLATGQVEQYREVSREFFAEGLTEFDGRLIQLTWQSGVGFVYRLTDFSPEQRFRYGGEGWGLTHDGERLIMSDGTATLRFLDPDDFRLLGTITVTDEDRPVVNLNELEFIDGEVWANIWYDERIARIDPATGSVLGWIDLGAIYPASQRSADAV